jgi:sec-independent protein translocase protein TatC
MTVELRVSFYTALLISVPFIMNRVWSFVKPGLKKKETIAVKRGAITSVILFITGAIFAYYIVVPNVIRILVGMIKSTPNIVFMPKVGENVSFVIIMLLSFGISFQLPIIMILCDKLKIISAKKQRKMWREYITCTVIVAALITPPDAISMLLLACPLIFLYFFTIFYFKIRHTNSPYKTEQKK